MQNAYTHLAILKITKTGQSNYEIDITVEFTLKNQSRTYIIHPYNAITIEIYLKQYICVISTIKGDTRETIVALNCKQMYIRVYNTIVSCEHMSLYML